MRDGKIFEEANAILHTLLVESEAKQPRDTHPLLRFSGIFRALLENVPLTQDAYPGAFGLESLPPEARRDWQARIAAAREKEVAFTDEIPECRDFQELGFGLCSDGGRGHTTIDFAQILRGGLKAICDRVKTDSVFDRAARETLLAVKAFAAKFDCRVPWEPAADLDEALASIWLVQECIILSEHVSWSYSWGRMDRYLLPFAEGVPQAELTRKFAAFFRFLDRVPFKDDAAALNLGGPDGFNRVTRAILDAAVEVRLPGPLLTVRVGENLSDRDFDLLMRRELLLCGQPTFYGEDACRAALLRRGMPQEEIGRWVANSCMGLAIPGREWQSMWGAVIPMPSVMELALNGGAFFRAPSPVPPDVSPVPPEAYADFEAFYAQCLRYADFLFRVCVRLVRANTESALKHFQNVFVSLFYDDCIVRQREVRDGGARYTTMIVETMGLADLADALVSVKKLVFEERKYTLVQIASALERDFADAADLLRDIRRLPKYGQNDPEADGMMRRLAADIGRIAGQFRGNGFFCAPSLHTLHAHIAYGSCYGSSADGRRSGAPFAKNAGTRPEVAAAHTSLVLSCSAWDQSRFSGGQPLDLWIDPAEWASEEGRARYRTLIRTYFARGGLQLQVNGADPEVLKDAMDHPEKYPDLSVRIGGFSMRFTAMSREQQLDFIRRFSAGM